MRLEQSNALPILAVMAKPLVRGEVKTRLAAHLGPDAALAIYGGLLQSTLDQAERLGGVDLVLAEPEARRGAAKISRGDHPAVQAPTQLDPLRSRRRWRRLPQRGEDLGSRLASVFAELFASGAPAVVIVASDSPPIPVEYLERAVGQVTNGALVLGPAGDGGYYLIGCDRETWAGHGAGLSALLAASPMSSPRLLTHTLQGIGALGLEPRQLPLWIDVDRADDLAVLARLSGDAPLRGGAGALREVYLHVTHRCGRSCRHCYDRTSVRDGVELSTAEWLAVIDQAVVLGARSFVFIGGDPLVRRDLTELIGHITGRRDARARFFFNSRITSAEAAALASAGRGRLTPLASVDGPRQINDALRGPGSYDDVMTSIGRLLAAGLEPVANTVMVRPALPGLTQLARELHAAGVRRLHLILPHQQGLAGEAAMLPSGPELLAAVRDVLEVADDIGLLVDNVPGWRRRIGRRNDLCAAGCRDLAIDPYGHVHACVITAGDPAFVAGSVREEPLERIWRESSALRLLRASRARDRAACRTCAVLDACGGECWVQAHYAARGRSEAAGYAAAFPYCDLVRPLLEELGATGAGGAAAGAADYDLFDCI